MDFVIFYFQTITLHNETLNRLQRVSLILEKGHYAYQSVNLVYVIIVFFSIVAMIIVIELFFYNRRVRLLYLFRKISFYIYLFSVK